MKIYLALISAAALALSACSQEATQPAAPAASVATSASAVSEITPATASEAASAPAETASATTTVAAGCETTVEGNDEMKYNITELEVKRSCASFTVHLKHVGKLPAAAMGHNIAISKAADAQAVAMDGAGATAANDFIKVGDTRALAHTQMIGGGEETSMTFDPAILVDTEQYEFFCTFPGHYALMKGNIKLVD